MQNQPFEFDSTPRVMNPVFLSFLQEANWFVRVYRELEIQIVSIDVTPALKGEKPRMVVIAPANVNPPTFGRLEVTRQLSSIH
ncbi:MAG: hypothetical protein RIR18_415 [Pseudomonadota bacterium]|jgi:hypothetical protein